MAKKRKVGSIDNDDDPPVPRMYKPINPKHTDRWDRVAQCERRRVTYATPFKTVVMQYCDDEIYGLGTVLCYGVHGMAAAEV